MGSVDIAVDERVAVVTLNRPAAQNAWDAAMQTAVHAAVTSLDGSDDVDGIVVTGAGGAFCAGQDLAEAARMTPDGVDAWLDNFLRLYDAILSSRKPIVAALNGVAAGSGYQFALLCDVRIGHDGVRIGQPEVSSGIPSITGLYLTLQSLGQSRTTELMLSGRLMDAAEAHAVGLIHRLVPREMVLAEAVATVRQLAGQPTVAYQLTKARLRAAIWDGLVEAFEVARETDRMAWASGEPQRVAQEFFETRRARRVAS
jgi:enoyl-CoA hydratase/carnithine racemase